MKEKKRTEWDHKRIKLLKIAQQVFARFGYFKATMEDIAHAMGMKKGSLYYYYKSKEDILREVIYYECDQFFQALNEKVSHLKDPRQKIETALQYRLVKFKEVMNLHNISIEAFLKTSEIVSELQRKCFEKEISFLAQIIQEGIDSGKFYKTDALKVARSLLTYAEAVKYREFYRNKSKFILDIDYSAIIDEIKFTTNLMLKGLEK